MPLYLSLLSRLLAFNLSLPWWFYFWESQMFKHWPEYFPANQHNDSKKSEEHDHHCSNLSCLNYITVRPIMRIMWGSFRHFSRIKRLNCILSYLVDHSLCRSSKQCNRMQYILGQIKDINYFSNNSANNNYCAHQMLIYYMVLIKNLMSHFNNYMFETYKVALN